MFSGTDNGEFVLKVVDEGAAEGSINRSDYVLEVTEVSGETIAIVSAAQPIVYPDHYFELLYDPSMYSPNDIQPGEEIRPEQNIFLAVTSQPGRIPLGVARIGAERSIGQALPAGTVLATASFYRMPFSRKRINSKAARSAVAGTLYRMQATLSDDGILVAWRGRHPGDYDLNGKVTISDITPLAVHFGTEPRMTADGFPVAMGENEYVAHIDTSGNGAVDIADVTAVAVHFGAVMSGYRLYLGVPDEEDNPVWGESFLANPENPDAPYTVPFSTTRQSGQFQTYAFQLSLEAAGDAAAFWLRARPTDGQNEGPPTDVQVFRSVPHEPFPCSVCHNEDDMSFKGIDATCLHCHPKPPEDKLRQWSEAPALHSACLGCHQAHEFRVSLPNDICASCHPTLSNESAGTGMEACMDCHAGPHLTVAEPPLSACDTCHAGTSQLIAASKELDCFACHQSHTWAANKDICSSCHDSQSSQAAGSSMPFCGWCHSNHDFAIESAVDSCQDCHAEEQMKVAGSAMPTCDTCHQSHLWAADISVCQDCHSSQAAEVGQSSMTGCNWCHGDHNFSTEFATATCQSCHAEEQAKVAGSAMPTCDICHESHLWAADSDGCQECHSSQAAEVAQSSMTGCNWCHSNHNFTTEFAAAACQSCHAEEQAKIAITSMPTCDICHESHLWAANLNGCQECHPSQATEVSQGSMTSCDWCHRDHFFDASTAEYWCTECHPTPPEDSSASWADAPQDHRQCASCHTAHSFGLSGFTVDEFCGTCHSEIAESTQASGMDSCISCHDTPHIPQVEFTTGDCGACHGTIYNLLNGTPKANCFTCHLPHDWQASPSVCASCHIVQVNDLAGSGMAECSLCHANHDFDPTGLFDACTDCHPRPLPALHEYKRHKTADCEDCHSAHGFSDTGREACVDCHVNRQNHNPGISCQECHDFTG